MTALPCGGKRSNTDRKKSEVKCSKAGSAVTVAEGARQRSAHLRKQKTPQGCRMSYLTSLHPPLVQSPEVKEVVAGRQKVPMNPPDMSVVNMVGEIEPKVRRKPGGVKAEYPWRAGGSFRKAAGREGGKAGQGCREPQDLFPRKPGGVKAEYPWRVGGAPRKAAGREGGKAGQGSRKARSILPKAPPPPLKAVLLPPPTATAGQVMIPVTLKTPCINCSQLIIASSLGDLKNHVCSRPEEEKTEACPVDGCGKRFSSKDALKYHTKQCQHTARPKKEVDIMTIATSELVARSKVVVGGLELLGGPRENFPGHLGGFHLSQEAGSEECGSQQNQRQDGRQEDGLFVDVKQEESRDEELDLGVVKEE